VLDRYFQAAGQTTGRARAGPLTTVVGAAVVADRSAGLAELPQPCRSRTRQQP
jgi:hypothetical protein